MEYGVDWKTGRENQSRVGLKSPFIMGGREGSGLPLASCGISLELMGEAAHGCSGCKGGEHCLPLALWAAGERKVGDLILTFKDVQLPASRCWV